MQIVDAINLIDTPEIHHKQPSVWTDLGCGKGVFTYALANLLKEQSTIYAVDKNRQSFRQNIQNKVNIEFVKADFIEEDLSLPILDGVLMANSLHYVANKLEFLGKMKKLLKKEGQFIIVEYDSMAANPWVPYPINYQHLKDLFLNAGFNQVIKLGERPSIYRRSNMYAAYIF